MKTNLGPKGTLKMYISNILIFYFVVNIFKRLVGGAG